MQLAVAHDVPGTNALRVRSKASSEDAPHIVNHAGTTHTVVIDDLPAETMKLLIDHLYGTFKPKLSFPQAVQLFIATDKYCIHDANLECIRVLKTHLADMPLVLPVLSTLADKHHCVDLQQVPIAQTLEQPIGTALLAAASEIAWIHETTHVACFAWQLKPTLSFCAHCCFQQLKRPLMACRQYALPSAGQHLYAYMFESSSML